MFLIKDMYKKDIISTRLFNFLDDLIDEGDLSLNKHEYDYDITKVYKNIIRYYLDVLSKLNKQKKTIEKFILNKTDEMLNEVITTKVVKNKYQYNKLDICFDKITPFIKPLCKRYPKETLLLKERLMLLFLDYSSSISDEEKQTFIDICEILHSESDIYVSQVESYNDREHDGCDRKKLFSKINNRLDRFIEKHNN